MRRNLSLVGLGLLLALAATGCANQLDSGTTRTLTERQRDSVIAHSVLPGAGVVGRAMQESDRAANLGANLDSLPH